MSPPTLVVHPSMRSLGEARWRALLPERAPPFLEFAWLDALERTGCAAPERGWIPHHLLLERAGAPLAAAAAWVKTDGRGEFVFDHGWARFAEGRLGRPYYPKLVLAVPFTPATGPRILLRPGEDAERSRQWLLQGVVELCRKSDLSSAHVLFPDDAEAAAIERCGWRRRIGVQFHWENRGYASFDDFLAGFGAKRRHQIRRERRLVREQGIAIEVRSGGELDAPLLDFLHSCYTSTVDKFVWGRRYLNRAFFEEIAATLPHALHVVVAREGRRPIAAAFNLLGADALYGRYWGAIEERNALHFEVCYYTGIEECIRRGLARFEPGAGGEHKVARGFLPTLTHSAHWLGHPLLDAAVARFCEEERHAILGELGRLRADP